VFGGIPVLNAGDGKPPMYWDQNLAHKFVDLTATGRRHVVQGAAPVQEPDDRARRDEGGTPYPFMVKWSSLAVPGALPSTWNEADATQDAGEFDLAEGQDPIVDGLGLKDSFIVYKESSTWALDYIGGAFILKSRKVSGMSGLLNHELRGRLRRRQNMHFAVTGSDIVSTTASARSRCSTRRRAASSSRTSTSRTRARCSLLQEPVPERDFRLLPVDRRDLVRHGAGLQLRRRHGDVPQPAERDARGLRPGRQLAVRQLVAGLGAVGFGPDRVERPGLHAGHRARDDGQRRQQALPARRNGHHSMARCRAPTWSASGMTFDAPERVKLITGILPRITGNNGLTVHRAARLGREPGR
jgi:hypothetical protein